MNENYLDIGRASGVPDSELVEGVSLEEGNLLRDLGVISGGVVTEIVQALSFESLQKAKLPLDERRGMWPVSSLDRVRAEIESFEGRVDLCLNIIKNRQARYELIAAQGLLNSVSAEEWRKIDPKLTAHWENRLSDARTRLTKLTKQMADLLKSK